MMRARACVLALAACGESGAKPDSSTTTARCDQAAAFSAPVPMAELNTAGDDLAARLTPDELTITFSRTSSNGTFDLFLATRADDDAPFGAPMLLGTVNTINSDVWSTLSPDGLLLMFDSDVTGAYHINASRRASTGDAFGPPRPGLALRDGEVHPMIANARSLYFASAARPGAGAHDIWYTEVDSTGAMDTPVALAGGINTADDEATPAVSADERHIYFRRTTASEADIYTASRSTTQDGFGAATKVDVVGVAGISETPSWSAADDCRLYFHSDAPNGSGGLDIYVARRGG
ncbi:MAG TPA: hypothetical protein VIV11_03745 [Kofleriaceae bacterium]